jgi:hypothetical protein
MGKRGRTTDLDTSTSYEELKKFASLFPVWSSQSRVDALYHPPRLQGLNSSLSPSSILPAQGEILMTTENSGSGSYTHPENPFNSSSGTILQEDEKLC